MNYFGILFLLIYLSSCGYPDIDNVPDFKNILLTDQEISDYCSINNLEKEKIDKCIIDYKSKNKL